MTIEFKEIEYVNNIIINSYLRCLAGYIRKLHKRKKFSDKNYIVNDNLNICNNKEELEILLSFANEIKSINKTISNNDICLSLLMVYYSLTVFEHDDELDMIELIKHADSRINVDKIFMEISGITCSGRKDIYVNGIKYNEKYFDYQSELNTRIRRYMILGTK